MIILHCSYTHSYLPMKCIVCILSNRVLATTTTTLVTTTVPVKTTAIVGASETVVFVIAIVDVTVSRAIRPFDRDSVLFVIATGGVIPSYAPAMRLITNVILIYATRVGSPCTLCPYLQWNNILLVNPKVGHLSTSYNITLSYPT